MSWLLTLALTAAARRWKAHVALASLIAVPLATVIAVDTVESTARYTSDEQQVMFLGRAGASVTGSRTLGSLDEAAAAGRRIAELAGEPAAVRVDVSGVDVELSRSSPPGSTS